MSSAPQSVLLVATDLDAQGDEVRRDLPEVNLTIAASVTAARAYLGASEFDVVIVGTSMPDDTAPALASLSESLGQVSRIVEGAPSVGLAQWVRDRLSLRSSAPGASVASASNELDDALAYVSNELSRIAHALNNPLAVIDGNAQLALELSKALGVDASVISAIEDIQGGSHALGALFADIANLRGRIDALTG